MINWQGQVDIKFKLFIRLILDKINDKSAYWVNYCVENFFSEMCVVIKNFLKANTNSNKQSAACVRLRF